MTKLNKITCGPSEDSDQTGQLPSLTSLHCQHEAAICYSSSGSGLKGLMFRLIYVYDGCRVQLC